MKTYYFYIPKTDWNEFKHNYIMTDYFLSRWYDYVEYVGTNKKFHIYKMPTWEPDKIKFRLIWGNNSYVMNDNGYGVKKDPMYKMDCRKHSEKYYLENDCDTFQKWQCETIII